MIINLFSILVCQQAHVSKVIIIIIIIIIVIIITTTITIIIIIVFLARLFMSNMLNCAEQVQI